MILVISFDSCSLCVILLLFGVFCAFFLKGSRHFHFSPNLTENHTGKRRAIPSSAEFQRGARDDDAFSTNRQRTRTNSSNSKQTFDNDEAETSDESAVEFNSFSTKKVKKKHDFVPTKAMTIIFSIARCAFHSILLCSCALCTYFLQGSKRLHLPPNLTKKRTGKHRGVHSSAEFQTDEMDDDENQTEQEEIRTNSANSSQDFERKYEESEDETERSAPHRSDKGKVIRHTHALTKCFKSSFFNTH